MEMMSSTCRHCGAERQPGDRFCTRCGQPEPSARPGATRADATGADATGLDATRSAGIGFDDTRSDVTALRSAGNPATAPSPAFPPPPGGYPYPPVEPGPLLPEPWPPREPEPWPPRGPASPRGPRRSRRAAAWIAAVVVVAGAVVAIAAIALPFTRPHSQKLNAASTSKSALAGRVAPLGTAATASSGPASPGAASPGSGPSASPSPAALTSGARRRAATSVAGMLTQSVSDRSAIAGAYADVDSCGPRLSRDAAVFTRAAASRDTLLAGLATLPGRSALPTALLSELTSAWRASSAADRDYARWASDEVSGGCTVDDTADAGYRAAATPDGEATAGKQAFTAAWNPIAARYGLTRYQPNQL